MRGTSNLDDRENETSREVSMHALTDSLLPPFGAGIARNLLYTVGFMRLLGEHEAAAVVDRAGTGKVHTAGERRADETVAYFDRWMQLGAKNKEATPSMERVRSIHSHYAKQYPMSQPTFVHSIAFFTLQLDLFLRRVGARQFNTAERNLQVAHWRAVGEVLGVEDMPDSWDGMERALSAYESSPEWFGFTPQARHASDALIGQFSQRWLLPGFRWVGRPILCSLHEPHVLDAIGQPHPPPVVGRIVRLTVRWMLEISRRLPAPAPLPL
ncbi:oxygenase MpaB family protein [Mycobacterium sp. BMJ-28]